MVSRVEYKAKKLHEKIKKMAEANAKTAKRADQPVVMVKVLNKEEAPKQEEKKKKSLKEVFADVMLKAGVFVATVRGMEATAKEAPIQDPQVQYNTHVADPEKTEKPSEFVMTPDPTMTEVPSLEEDSKSTQTEKESKVRHSGSYSISKEKNRVEHRGGLESGVRYTSIRPFLGGRTFNFHYTTPEERAANKARLEQREAEIKQARIDKENAEREAAIQEANKAKAEEMKKLWQKDIADISLEEFVTLNNYYQRNGTDKQRQGLNTKAEEKMRAALNGKIPLSMNDVEHLESFQAAMLGCNRKLMKEVDDNSAALIEAAQKAHEAKQPAWKRWLKKTFGKKDQTAAIAKAPKAEDKPWFSEYKFDKEKIDESLKDWARLASKQSSNNMEKGLFKLPNEFKGIAQNMYRYARDHTDEDGNINWDNRSSGDAKKFMAAKEAYETRKAQEAENKKKGSADYSKMRRSYDKNVSPVRLGFNPQDRRRG